MERTALIHNDHPTRNTGASAGLLAGCPALLSRLLFSVALLTLSMPTHADELILDESLTEFQPLGDFSVSSFNTPLMLESSGMFNDEGEITAGQLYTFFKNQGLESVDEIRLALDVDPSAQRSDFDFESMELSIEDLKYSLGPNSIHLPGYETSDVKPEAQIAIKLDYDFMQRYNESSTEKLKFNYGVKGEQAKVPIKIGVAPAASYSGWSANRIFVVSLFALFWIIIFAILFRATAPGKSANSATTQANSSSPKSSAAAV